jgi:hypothetical protein
VHRPCGIASYRTVLRIWLKSMAFYDSRGRPEQGVHRGVEVRAHLIDVRSMNESSRNDANRAAGAESVRASTDAVMRADCIDRIAHLVEVHGVDHADGRGERVRLIPAVVRRIAAVTGIRSTFLKRQLVRRGTTIHAERARLRAKAQPGRLRRRRTRKPLFGEIRPQQYLRGTTRPRCDAVHNYLLCYGPSEPSAGPEPMTRGPASRCRDRELDAAHVG